MSNHPNRGGRKPTPGYNPKPEEISQLRQEMKLTQKQFGALLYRGLSTVQAWEDGTRRMPGLDWEYISLLWSFPQVAKARAQWLSQNRLLQGSDSP